MQEAILYQKIPHQNVQCEVCNHFCKIRPNKRGICGVRENYEGILYALNYGETIAAGIDPIEKKPLYHFLPNTNIYSFAAVGCNLQCPWCQNWEISQSLKPNKPIHGKEITPQEHVKRAIDYHCPSIAYTYSEPTVFIEYALETMKLAKQKGLKNVWVSNGYMSEKALDILIPYLDAANIDYKGPDDTVYQKFCGNQAAPVTKNLQYIHKAGVHLEITTLIIPGVNDKYNQIEEIVHFIAEKLSLNIPWHISRFFPAWKMQDKPVTPLETLEMAKKIAQKFGLKYVHIGNV